MSVPTIRCLGMNSRRGACVVVTSASNDDDDAWIEVTLSPEEVTTFIDQLLTEKMKAINKYGRKDVLPPKQRALA
jgi:hypothetical protein